MKKTKEQAIQAIVDLVNIMGKDESTDIWKLMNIYASIRELPDDEKDKAYEEIAKACGFMR